MSNTIEMKLNKKGVYEAVKKSKFWEKINAAYKKMRTFIADQIKTFKSKSRIKEIKEGLTKFGKDVAIATALSIAWGVVTPGLWTATLAGAFTVSTAKEIKSAITAKKENKHYKFNAFNFILETAVSWVFAIIGAYALIGIIPIVFQLMAYTWVYSLIFLFV